MIDRFDHVAPPMRVRFGAGRRKEVADAVDRLGAGRALVLSTPEQEALAREIAGYLGERSAGVFAGARMHTPVETTEAAVEAMREAGADCVVSVGGGSTTGLGKAIGVRLSVPQVAIPTTYAGSEMTDILGETRDGEKVTRRAEEIRPDAVIYDVELTLSLPPALSATSGVNAIAHAVEALYARDGNPVVSLMAEEGVRALAEALPVIVRRPDDIAARTGAQYGAWLCGACLGAVSMALHHKLCHVLGGRFDLPHAETHAIVLPHATAYNAAGAPDAMARLSRALGEAGDGRDAAAALFRLNEKLAVPVGLREIGMPEEGIDGAADAAVAGSYWNPSPLERDRVRALIAAAWAGDPPRGSLV